MSSKEIVTPTKSISHEVCIALCKLNGGCYLDNKGYLWKIVDGKEVGKPSIQMPDLHREWCENLTEDELREAIKAMVPKKLEIKESRYIVNVDKLTRHIQEVGLDFLYKIANVSWQNLYWINEAIDYSKYKKHHFKDGIYSPQEQVKQHQEKLKAIRYGIKEGFISYIK